MNVGILGAGDVGRLVVLATLGMANESAITMAGPEYFRGKVLIDTGRTAGHVHLRKP